MKIAICFACVVAIAAAESWMAAPYTLVKRGKVLFCSERNYHYQAMV